jgi:hypothetical protein
LLPNSTSGAGAARPGYGCPKSAPAAGSAKLHKPANGKTPIIAAANAMFRAKPFDFIRVILFERPAAASGANVKGRLKRIS